MSVSVSVSELNNIRNSKPVIVLFFAQGCIYCEKMMPEWNKFKKSSPITFSEVSANEMSEYNPLDSEENIRGYPTIRLYNKGKLVKEYDGDRSKKDILKFIKKYIKENKAKKNNLLMVKARKSNSLNKKLLKRLTKRLSKRKKNMKKRTRKNKN